MANKQNGLLQLTGATQNMIFFKKKNGEFGFKRKSGITAERFNNDPNYEQLRLNAQDFAKAGKASMLIKRAFASMTPKHASSTLFPRLTKVCKAVIKSDLTHERGSRKLLDGDMNLLTHFDFSETGNFSNTVHIAFTHSIDRVAGTAKIELPAYIPGEMVKFPDKATHFRLRMGVAALNFETAEYVPSVVNSADIPLDKNPTAPVALTAEIPTGSTDPVFIALAVEYMEQEGSVLYPILNSKFNLMKLVAVDVPA